jgi:hypothetical protein
VRRVVNLPSGVFASSMFAAGTRALVLRATLGAAALVAGALGVGARGTATSGATDLVEDLALAKRPGCCLTGSSLAVAEVSTCC